jgi:hypothetical protein
MADSKPSGKVGGQDAGRGTVVGRDPKPDGVDQVDAGPGRAVGLEQENAVEDRSALGNLDHVENDNPIKNPLEGPDGQLPGSLEDEGKTMEEKVGAIEGLQSGGLNASDGG